jgi:hypothetical protein
LRRFEQATGIKPYDWSKYWARFGDALLEAGFKPNTLQRAYTDEYMLEQIALLTRELGKFPTDRERRMKRFNDPNFPDANVFYSHFKTKDQLVLKALEYAQTKPEHSDILEIIKDAVPKKLTADGDKVETVSYGFVYLLKERPGHYKIGVSDDPERRVYELTKGPYKPLLESKIQTDDPFGVEAYWHKRFEEKWMRGEWFKLNVADVKAFKLWKRIY